MASRSNPALDGSTAEKDDDRYERGLEMIKKVYAGRIAVPPRGAMAFSDLMLEQLFAEVWTREALSIRDRRLIVLGVVAAMGETDTFGIQVRAALENEELDPEELREVLITLANYAGYARASALVVPIEQQIAEAAKKKKTSTT